MLQHLRRLPRPLRVLVHVGAWAASLVALALVLWAFDARRMPALEPWHTADLRGEARAADLGPEVDLASYLEIEERVFRELDDEVVDALAGDPRQTSRYVPGGLADPESMPRNWNRTVELVPDAVRGGALLVHGLSDSPYSMRATAELLAARGLRVLCLRLPGHGTAPVGLRHAGWKDWRAAVALGARHVASAVEEGEPVIAVGYSCGAALVLQHALEGLEEADGRPRFNALVLLSPAVGVTWLARLADVHLLLSFLPAFEKFAWLGIEQEFDPFKYNSFPKRAATEMYWLASDVSERVARLAAAQRLPELPPLLAFQSLVDATVRVEPLFELFDRLGDEDELVVFDVNRDAHVHRFLVERPDHTLDALLARMRPYRLTLVGNAQIDSLDVVAERFAAGSAGRTGTAESLGLVWPRGVYSLSHVALPFPPDDPIYGAALPGAAGDESAWGIRLGAIEARGERDLLRISLHQLMRLRHNPFFDVVEARLDELVDKL